jgi:hypothetical protein
MLVEEAIERVHASAITGASIRQVETHLAALDLRTTGRKSSSCRVLSEQILLWYDAHDPITAHRLSREAVIQHTGAAMLSHAAADARRTKGAAATIRLLSH